MKIYVGQDGAFELRTHDKVPVLHRSETRGIVIAETQDVELWVSGAHVETMRHRFWRNAETNAIDHIDSIKVA